MRSPTCHIRPQATKESPLPVIAPASPLQIFQPLAVTDPSELQEIGPAGTTPDGPDEPEYDSPLTVKWSQQLSVLNATTLRGRSGAATTQLSPLPYSDGKFGLVTHRPPSTTWHEPLTISNSVGVSIPATAFDETTSLRHATKTIVHSTVTWPDSLLSVLCPRF